VYTALLLIHSLCRWLVIVSLFYAILRAYNGIANNIPFSKSDNTLRHWTATFTHIQLMIGYTLYFISPLVKTFFVNKSEGLHNADLTFFSIIHILLMTAAVVVITIGSARTKRKETGRDKYKTMLRWFAAGILIIFVAIPWPFSPLAKRPWWRTAMITLHRSHSVS
jgi:hypothetical protein